MGPKEKNQEGGGFVSAQNTFAMNDPTISYQNWSFHVNWAFSIYLSKVFFSRYLS